jgi:stage III sporulation protein SpoIIIAA
MRQVIADDLDVLFSALPSNIRESLVKRTSSDELIEIILDLGRLPEAAISTPKPFSAIRK